MLPFHCTLSVSPFIRLDPRGDHLDDCLDAISGQGRGRNLRGQRRVIVITQYPWGVESIYMYIYIYELKYALRI